MSPPERAAAPGEAEGGTDHPAGKLNTPEGITLDAALDYIGRGWPVFPLVPGDKRPATRRGFHDATLDVEQVRRWWTEQPAAGIGLPTGVTFDVLDVDHTDYAAGVADLADCAIEAAPVVRTGSGKWHVYTKPTGIGRRIRFAEHCDWLGTGGYVIAPPSVHPDTGDRYAWWRIDDVPVGPDPDTVNVRLCDPPAQLVQMVLAPRNTAPAPTRPTAPTRASGGPSGWSAAGLIATVAAAPVGQRNDALHWAARRLADDLSARRAARAAVDAALDELEQAAIGNGLARGEVVATIRSALQAGRGGAA